MSDKTTKINNKLSRKYLSVVAIVTTLIGGSFFFHEYVTDVQAKEKTELIESAAIEKEIEQFEKALSQKAYNALKETRVKTAIVERKERLAEQAKEEAERLAKEKKEKEEAEAKRLEEERLAEEKRIAEERLAAEQSVVEEISSYEAYEDEVETAPTQYVSAPAATEVVEEEPVSAPQPVVQQTTSGFNFNGRHFDLSWFSGSGQVPADNYVYRWSDDPSHYLIERMGTAGAYIKEIGVGSQVIIDGQSYTVFRVDSGITNDMNAYYNMKGVGATITFQTCDHTVGANGRFDLTIWYAHPS